MQGFHKCRFPSPVDTYIRKIKDLQSFDDKNLILLEV